MLHTKVHGNLSTGSKEGDFLKFFLPYMSVEEAIWLYDQHYINIFSFGLKRSSGF